MNIRRKLFFLVSAFLIVIFFGNLKLLITEAATSQITVNGRIGETVSTSEVKNENEEDNPNKNASDKGEDSERHFPNTGENLQGQKIMIGVGTVIIFFSVIIAGERRKSKNSE